MGFNDFSSGVKLNNIKAYGGVNTATNDAFKKQIYSDIEEIDYGSYEDVGETHSKLNKDSQDKPNFEIRKTFEGEFVYKNNEIYGKLIRDKNGEILYDEEGNPKVIPIKQESIFDNSSASSKVWSVFYGGSAKHTKDFLGIFSGNVASVFGGLKIDPHNRQISYDKNDYVYVKGKIYGKAIKDENDNYIYDEKGTPKIQTNPDEDPLMKNRYGNKKQALVATLTDKVSNSLEILTAKSRDPRGNIIYDYDEKGSFRVKESGFKTYQDAVRNWDKEKVDPWLNNSKLGQKVRSINRKLDDKRVAYGLDPYGAAKIKIGSDNDYRVGQNLKYGNVSLYSKSIGDTGSIYNVGKFETGNKFVGASGRMDLGYGKYNAAAEIGLWRTELSASAEASVLHTEISSYVGNGQEGIAKLGADGNVSADIGKVYANGMVSAGLYKDKDGITRLDAGVKIAAGADLCSATAKGNVDLGPVSVGGQATVKVGIGAQANVGFEDGVFNLHLGIALGVGVELGVSVDLSRGTQFVIDSVDSLIPEEVKTGAKAVVDFLCFWN